MDRTLRPGPFGHLVVALVSLAFLVAFWILHMTGTPAFPESLVFVGVMYFLLTAGLLRVKIHVGKEALEYRSNYWMAKTVNYEAIAFSRVTTMGIIGDVRRPYLLEVYETGSSWPALKILLMPFGADDTGWLLGLEQLRIVEQ